MKFFLKSRSSLVLGASSLLSLLLLVVLGDLPVVMPSLLGGSTALPLGVLLPLMVVVVLGYGYSWRDRPQEQVTRRPRNLYDVGIALALTVGSAIATVVIGVASEMPELPHWYLRNLILMSGLVLLFTGVRAGAVGSLTVVTLLVTTTAYGPYNRGARFVRVFQNESDDTWSWVVAIAAYLVGLASMLLGGRLRR